MDEFNGGGMIKIIAAAEKKGLARVTGETPIRDYLHLSRACL